MSPFVGNKAKERISKRVFQEKKICKFFETQTFLFGKFGVLCFLETPVLRFDLSAYYQCIFKDGLQI